MMGCMFMRTKPSMGSTRFIPQTDSHWKSLHVESCMLGSLGDLSAHDCCLQMLAAYLTFSQMVTGFKPEHVRSGIKEHISQESKAS